MVQATESPMLIIPERQNLPENIGLRRAIAQAYFEAKVSHAGQVVVTVALPTIVALMSISSRSNGGEGGRFGADCGLAARRQSR